MIHTNDLMLGNYVVCRVGGKDSEKRSIPMKVVALFDDCAYLDFDGNEGDVWEEKDDGLFGIEITEELLVEIGCIKQVKQKPSRVQTYPIIWTEYTMYDISAFFTVKGKLGNWSILVGTTCIGNITYLHQLQNAYHMLTGKDLEVRL